MKMKSFIPVIILLIVSVNGVCQNWQPFPRGQQSYFKHLSLTKHPDDGRTEVVRYQLDSLWGENEQLYTYFITGSFLKDKSHLTDHDSLLFNCYNYYSEYRDNNEIDRFIKRGDSLLFTGLGNIFPEVNVITDTVVFKPFCRESDSWVSNGKTIRCTGTDVSTIFGITDSIKTFTIYYSTYTISKIILSKNYGLIKFSPFNFTYDKRSPWKQPFIDEYELIGFSNKTISKGYRQPNFSDYFHLNAGDVLFWEETVTVPDFGFIYHKDSLVSVDKTPNSITYQYQRTAYDQNKNITEVTTASDVYQMTKEGVIFANQPSWYGYQTWDTALSVPYRFLFLSSALQLEFENSDTITNLECSFTPVYSHLDSCKIREAENVSSVIIDFSTLEGVTAKATEKVTGDDYLLLIGSKINGVKRGVTDFVYTGLNEFESGKVKLFPNPVINELSIQIPNETVERIELYDLNGRLVLSSDKSETINISHVNHGIYVIKIQDSKNIVRFQKIVKEN
jgi:hypothetical protein